MSIKLDRKIKETGTRFKIFPQPRFLPGFETPEVITINIDAGRVTSGPEDDRFYTVDAVEKRPYEYPYLPPYRGKKNPEIKPGRDGHFDHLELDSREFQVAHMYAVARRALDIWEDYFGRKIEWIFRLHYDRMELVPLIKWDNAHSGYGFLEFGYGRTEWKTIDFTKPFCMNFDVIVHELVHNILFSEVGFPDQHAETYEFWGFHEAAADLGSIIIALHSDLVVERLLKHSKGNLFTFNELARVGELSENQHIRNAFNYERMSTVSDESHDLSKPLTGAIFDIFVEVFQEELVNDNLISQELADLSYHGPEENPDVDDINRQFALAYEGNEERFKDALLRSRDYFGELMAMVWDRIEPAFLNYAKVGLEVLSADVQLTGGKHQDTIRECFAWREIHFPPESPELRTWEILRHTDEPKGDRKRK
jgi:hypothetical protein